MINKDFFQALKDLEEQKGIDQSHGQAGNGQRTADDLASEALFSAFGQIVTGERFEAVFTHVINIFHTGILPFALRLLWGNDDL